MAAPGEHHADEMHLMFILKGGGVGQQDLPVPADPRGAEQAEAAGVPRGEDQDARHLRLPALSPVDRDRRHQRRDEPQDREARLARAGSMRCRPTGDKSGHAFRDPELEAEIHKLTQNLGIGAQFGGKYFCHDVRVIRLRAPRRLAADRHRRVVLRRPPDQGEDHGRGRVPGGAGARPGALPARAHRGHPRRRGGEDRPQPPDGRDPRGALEAPGEDPRLADRHHGGRARHRACQAAGTARCRAGPAAIHQGPPGLLRRPGQDAGGLRHRLLRPDHGRAHGQLCRGLPGRRRVLRDAGQGQPLARPC